MQLDSERQPIPDVPAIYFLQPSEDAVARVVQDAQLGLYDTLHLNFTTHLSRPLLEKLAAGVEYMERGRRGGQQALPQSAEIDIYLQILITIGCACF